MVDAISSTSLLSALTTGTSSSDGASLKASIEAQIEAKTAELEDAKTDEDKQAIDDEIAVLQAKLRAAEAAEAKKAEAQQRQAPAPLDQTATKIGTRNFEDGEAFGTRSMWI